MGLFFGAARMELLLDKSALMSVGLTYRHLPRRSFVHIEDVDEGVFRNKDFQGVHGGNDL